MFHAQPWRQVINREKNMLRRIFSTQITKGLHSESPNLSFLGSSPKSGNNKSIFFHYKEPATWRMFPSYFISSAYHVIFFASFALEKTLLNLEIIGKYHNTLAGECFLLTLSLTSPFYPSTYSATHHILDIYPIFHTLSCII